MEQYTYFSFITGFPLELLGAVFVFGFPIEKRTHFVIRLCVAILSSFTILNITVVLGQLIGFYQPLLYLIYGIMCVGIFIIMVFGIWLVCKIKFKEAMYCATCAYLTEHMVYCLRLIIHHFSGLNLVNNKSFFYYSIHILSYFLAYHIFAKRMIKENHYATGAVQSLWLSLSTLFMVLVMSLVSSIYQFSWIHGIYALFCCFFVLVSQVNQLQQLNLQKELNFNQQLWTMHKNQFEFSKEHIDIINRKCHDIKHQMKALRQISDLDKQQEVLDSMEHSIQMYESILETGNEILDTVLTEKSLICTANNIDLNCIIDGKLLDFMDIVDLYTLFGNALDNAIEGVLSLDHKENRGISILIHEKVNLIFIQVENHYQGNLNLIDGLPITSKEDKIFHGFGLKSIIHIAEKYGGFVNLETDHEIFVLRITIPQP